MYMLNIIYDKIIEFPYTIGKLARHPFEGVGKPEPLKFNYAGFWSRRIDEEHRLIYRVVEDEVQIAKCSFYYD